MMAYTYHGTPMTPKAAFAAVMAGRGACVSFYAPQDLRRAIEQCPFLMMDHGGFSFWMAAMRKGEEWDQESRDAWWLAYYAWLDPFIHAPGRFAIIPDSPGAPSQVNDGLLNDWPYGRTLGSPVWHMDGPIARLGKLCERYDRVCIGWIGDPKVEPVGCSRYRRRMDEVAQIMGNRWHPLHMLRGVAVGGDYPFASVDSTSLAQNGHRHDWRDTQPCMIDAREPAKWNGRRWYADNLEAMAA